MKETVQEYKNYIKDFLKNKKYMFCLLLTTILSYSFMLTHFSVNVDDLSLDRYVSDTYILSAGRWGTWLVYNILNLRNFTPFWLDFLVVLILFFTAIFLSCVLKKISKLKLKESSYIIFSVGFISFPVISNFIVYQPTNLTVAFSNLLIVIAVAMIYDNFLDRKSKLLIFLVGLFLAFPISMYESCCQTFVVLVFIVSFLHCKFNNEIKFKEIFKFYFACFITLLIGIVFNYLINILIYFVLDRLSIKRENLANKKTFKELLNVERLYLVKLLMNDKITDFFTNKTVYIKEFVIIFIVGFIFSIFELIKNKNKKIFIIYILIIFSNFILLLLMVKNLYRVCYSWAITVGFILLFINEICNFRKSKIIYIVLGYIILMQTKYMNSLFYNDYITYQREVLYVNTIISELQEKCEDLNKPLLFVADEKNYQRKNLKLNDDNGENYFEWSIDSFFGEQYEMVKFFNHLGYDFKIVDDVEKSTEIFENLDENTRKEPIIELEDFIVVKINAKDSEKRTRGSNK